jgi:uncharacterized membrane protein YebE (DUF533 family)
MASNQSVLEQLLQTALSGGGLREGQRAGGRGQTASSASSGDLGEILGSLLGGGQMTAGSGATPSRAAPGGAGGLGDLLGALLGGSQQAGGDAGGAESYRGAPGSQRMPADPGSTTGSLQQQAEMPQKSGMNDLIRYGGIAVIGALAYQALKRYQGQQGSAQEQVAGQKASAAPMMPPPDSGFHPGHAPADADALSEVLVKAMVGATQADGVIDEDEQQRLAGRLDQLGVGSNDRRALVQQLTTPVDPREIVDAATSPEMGLQIYAASVLAVAVDTPAERSYLDGLAKALGIEPGLKAQVEQTLRRG